MRKGFSVNSQRSSQLSLTCRASCIGLSGDVEYRGVLRSIHSRISAAPWGDSLLTNKMWMVRAERGAAYLDDFLSRGVVTIGGHLEGDLRALHTQSQVLQRVQEVRQGWKPGRHRIWASQIYRFAHEISEMDNVITYDPQQRLYHVGMVNSSYNYQPEFLAEHPNYRKVEWEGTVSRDVLSTATKNSLGAISTLFLVPQESADEIRAALESGEGQVAAELSEEDPSELLEDLEARAAEFIKDRISKLSWEEMQELVAGLLRGMGYKTRVSPSGPDRGKDIIASPDGFGFENPRIVVEVKHRTAAMGSQEIRSFLGGRHQNDKGLYVSIGGFSKDAYYEAERANIPLTLMNLDDLVLAVVDYYERLDLQTQQLVPLKKVYWPV